MSNTKIAQVVVGLPVDGPFDYTVSGEMSKRLSVGNRVGVLFNNRKKVAFVVGIKKKSSFKDLNPILSVLDTTPLIDETAMKLTSEFADYYGCTLGEAIETYLPSALRKPRSVEYKKMTVAKAKKGESVTNELVHNNNHAKTWQHIVDRIKSTIKKKSNVILLVPEVAMIDILQKQLNESISAEVVISKRSGRVVKQTDDWLALKGLTSSVVIGTRSTIFAPVSNLGLIIVLDEDNSAYKQEQSPYYHVDQVVAMRSKLENADVMYVSVAPSIETYSKQTKKNWKYKYVANDKWADIQIVDMTNYNPGKTSILSFPLQNKINSNLLEKKSTLIILNRRGFGMSTRCQKCGHMMKCERCDVMLSFHFSKKQLSCRSCQSKRSMPKVCPSCKCNYLRSTGVGIEKCESDLNRLYPDAKIVSYDKEKKKLNTKADIVIATQAVLRYKDIWQADTVAILDFDAQLNRVDYRSSHTAFSFLTQLRMMAKTSFIVQTRLFDHYCLQSVVSGDIKGFYKKELEFRRELNLPPFSQFAAIMLRGKKEDDVFSNAQKLFDHLNEEKDLKIQIAEPQPASIPKIRDQYRYEILVNSSSNKILLSFIKKHLKTYKRKGKVIITINVDP